MSTAEGRQLVFDLAGEPDLSRQALVEASCNKLAIAWIDRWPDWPAPLLIVHGPPSSGKSHLLRLWAQASGASLVDTAQLGRGPRPTGLKAAAIDDVDLIAGDRAAEEALFHLYNELNAAGGSLLVTAEHPVSQWPVGLPDLVTRLRAAPQVAIGAPDDEALMGVIRKQLKDRQLDVPEEDLRFAIYQIERSFLEAARFAAFLDRVSLRDHKRLTRRFIASVVRDFIAG